MAEQMKKDAVAVSFKDTLNLPKTDFAIRPNSTVDDPALIERWEREELYTKSFFHNAGSEKYIFHDGPPYANGPIHTGSAYNKILKDIITKAQRMMGKQVPITPGWDCHGLPIEIKVTQEHSGLSGAALKKACRAYASQWIDIQRKEFKRLGVVMDWDNPYITMSPSYQAAIMRAFGIFVSKGLIERKNKTVPWCFTCKTVLATAEIEYHDRKDPSVYVLFPLHEDTIQQLIPSCKNLKVSLAVWTTTPWTLPLNRAVLLKPDAPYVVLDIEGTYIVVAEPLADALCTLREVPKNIVASFFSGKIAIPTSFAYHPFIQNLSVPLLLDDSVSLQEGTACVHCAPGAGPIDYEVGIKNNIAIYSPVAPDGTYTQDVLPSALAGMSVTDGQWWVLKTIKENGHLLYKTTVNHSYPHCWRCRNGLIFRATKQWFFDLEKQDIKEKATRATYSIKAYPEKSINRLRAMVSGRLEWCISRQRVWGVPIPALLCTYCDNPYYSKKMADDIAAHVAIHGIEWWDDATIEQIISDNKTTCASCGKTEWLKEHDILDVWFDSGISHYAVLEQDPRLGTPADLYLEGSDQHRGWFQSSLLTSIALHGRPPMRSLYTHGFVVDAKGHKMSKSLGNVIAPEELIKRLGTDGLRMWAASVDNSGEAILSETVLNNVQEVFRRVRNTLRFLLSNLYDFDIQTDVVRPENLMLIDQHALQELVRVHHSIINAYQTLDTTSVFHTLGEYCSTALSAIYLDIIKDRLYVERANSHLRRSAQTVCYHILDTLTKLSAPILSFTAEQVSDLYQKDKKVSIHLQTFCSPNILYTDAVAPQEHNELWRIAHMMRSALLKAIEGKREVGIIKHPLEARITIYLDPEGPLYDTIQKLFAYIHTSTQNVEQFLREFSIVSQVILIDHAHNVPEATIMNGVFIDVEHAHGTKCPRCWQWDEAPQKDDLCRRCSAVLSQI